MTKTFDADVIVVGGGPSGLTLTALLAARGVQTICIDRDNPKTQAAETFDGRTIAISFGSHTVLDAAGVWASLEEHACPIKTIDILDGDSPSLLKFDSSEADGKIFGWIGEMHNIRRALFTRVAELKNATHLAPASVADFERDDDGVSVHLADGRILRAPLVVGADGRQSFTREWMGIGTRGWSYRQTALVCTVEHEHPHHFVAIEHFLPEGPFAILPVTDAPNGTHRSAIVWTEHGKPRNSAIHLDETAFNAALAERFPESYGWVRLVGKRFSYPLGLIHAYRYIAPRMALVADAAHGIHPVAGQGLNLGFRDVSELADLVTTAKQSGKDIGSEELLETYQRARRFDNMAMAGTCDKLVRLFSNDLLPLRLVRRAGLKMVATLPPAKRFFMKQAMGGDR